MADYSIHVHVHVHVHVRLNLSMSISILGLVLDCYPELPSGLKMLTLNSHYFTSINNLLKRLYHNYLYCMGFFFLAYDCYLCIFTFTKISLNISLFLILTPAPGYG